MTIQRVRNRKSKTGTYTCRGRCRGEKVYLLGSCKAIHDKGYSCTLPKGHRGKHSACGGINVHDIVVWESKKKGGDSDG